MRRTVVAAFLVFLGFLVTATGTGRAAGDTSAVDMARAKVAAGDAAGAMHDLDAYVPAHPNDLAAARLLGDLYFRIPDYKHAEGTWKAILTHAPGDHETHNRLGSLYAAEDRVPDAIAEYEKSLPNRGGFLGLVAQHRRQGDLAEFEAHYARDAQQNPLDARAQSFYASVLRALRKFDLAQTYYERVANANPTNCGALIDVGNNLIDLARIPRALDYFNRCLRMEPDNYAANVDTGEAYIELRNYAKARSYLDRAIAAKSDGSEAFVNVGIIEDANGLWKQAVQDYVRAMNADPLEAAAYIDLGYDYSEHQLYLLAEAAFIKGLSVAPDEGRLHYLLGSTYNVQGKVVLAREQYLLALASPESIVVRAAQRELALLPKR